MASYIFRNRDKRKLTENDSFPLQNSPDWGGGAGTGHCLQEFSLKALSWYSEEQACQCCCMFVLFRFVTKDLFSHFAWTSCLPFVACRASKAFSCSYATLISFWIYQCNRPSWWWFCSCWCSFSFCHLNYDGRWKGEKVITWLTEAGFIRAGCC